MSVFESPVIGDADGLRSSFAEFVGEVEPRLRAALCVGLGLERGTEAAADALAYGWEHWDRVRQMSNPVGYLYRVGRSRARQRRTPRPTFPELSASASPWIEPGLPAGLTRLSEKQRTVVWLVHGYEWTLGETASLLGISVSTVRNHLARGEEKLRKTLGVSE